MRIAATHDRGRPQVGLANQKREIDGLTVPRTLIGLASDERDYKAALHVQSISNRIESKREPLPLPSRYTLKHTQAEEMDSVLDALHEELDKGRPTQIPSWKKVEVMSDEAIDAESHAFAEKYEGILPS